MTKYPTLAQMVELNKAYDDKIVLVIDNKLVVMTNEKAVETHGDRRVTHLDVTLVRCFERNNKKVMLSLEVE